MKLIDHHALSTGMLVAVLILIAGYAGSCDTPLPCDCAPSITCDSLYVRGWQEGINWQKAEQVRQEANSDGV